MLATSAHAAGPPETTEWPVTEGSPGGGRYSPRTDITRDNVGQLELLWEHVTVQSTSTPAVVDDIVYYADWSGKLYAKNTDDGSEVWTADLDGGTTASPAVTEDKVFIGGGGAVTTSRLTTGGLSGGGTAGG